MAGRPKKKKTLVIYLRVPEPLGKRLKEDASNEGRELSGKIRLILEAHYAEAK
jgi:predicted DNA binding CopG/RHH family protein